jgi:hypothetical protein
LAVLVRLCRKIFVFYTAKPFTSDEGEEVDEEEEPVEVAPRSGPRIKNASNAFVPSSRVEIKANMKKLYSWKRYVLCMNVDIDKKLHS